MPGRCCAMTRPPRSDSPICSEGSVARAAAHGLRLRWANGAGRIALLALLAVHVGVFALWPLVRLLVLALAPGAGGEPLGLLAAQWASPAAQRALVNTLTTSLAATLVSVVLGTAAAALIALTDIRGKTAAVFVLFLPLLVPSQITALAWI